MNIPFSTYHSEFLDIPTVNFVLIRPKNVPHTFLAVRINADNVLFITSFI